MVTAALGGEFNVPTIDGRRRQVKIPEGTQSGKQFRIKGKGMPVLRSREVGDLYIQVFVETPQNLTKRQRELLQEFDQAASTENHPEAAGFFAKMSDFFGGLGGPRALCRCGPGGPASGGSVRAARIRIRDARYGYGAAWCRCMPMHRRG